MRGNPSGALRLPARPEFYLREFGIKQFLGSHQLSARKEAVPGFSLIQIRVIRGFVSIV
jgi:hypothetical protein